MSEVELQFTVNGTTRSVATDPNKTLLSLLREDLDLTAAKEGCGQGDCGSCIVIMDGLAVNACLVLAAQAEDAEVVTLEGLASDGKLHPLQRNFAEKWGFQCGYCTPGMIMSCYALLCTHEDPNLEQIQTAIAGNLCRCTNYRSIIESVQAAAADLGAQV